VRRTWDTAAFGGPRPAPPASNSCRSTSASGESLTWAYGIGNNGIAVGESNRYDSSGARLESAATIWYRNGTALDLNSLGLENVTGDDGTWRLTHVTSIADNGWIAGLGQFTPAGSQWPYPRAWISRIQLVAGRVVADRTVIVR
jgi:hypothetical protein